jgi:hypothetical protein
MEASTAFWLLVASKNAKISRQLLTDRVPSNISLLLISTTIRQGTAAVVTNIGNTYPTLPRAHATTQVTSYGLLVHTHYHQSLDPIKLPIYTGSQKNSGLPQFPKQ